MTHTTTGFPKLMRYALSLAAVPLLFSACNKEQVTGPAAARQVTPSEKQEVREMIAKLPSVGIYNRTMDKVLVFKRNPNGPRGFSFTTAPANGINFATSNGGQWVWTADGGMVVLTQPSAGLGSGGGIVVAGNSTLNIDFAACFAVGEDALGGGLFGPDMGEVAGVIGIAGDFEALANGDFNADEDDIFDYFHGFAYYFVYADHLSDASYDVMNWIDDLDSEEDFHDVSFAFAVDLRNEGGIYLSKDGAIHVSGGTMDFNGNYYAVTGIGFFDDGDGEAGDVSVVSGYGAMGCE